MSPRPQGEDEVDMMSTTLSATTFEELEAQGENNIRERPNTRAESRRIE